MSHDDSARPTTHPRSHKAYTMWRVGMRARAMWSGGTWQQRQGTPLQARPPQCILALASHLTAHAGRRRLTAQAPADRHARCQCARLVLSRQSIVNGQTCTTRLRPMPAHCHHGTCRSHLVACAQNSTKAAPAHSPSPPHPPKIPYATANHSIAAFGGHQHAAMEAACQSTRPSCHDGTPGFAAGGLLHRSGHSLSGHGLGDGDRGLGLNVVGGAGLGSTHAAGAVDRIVLDELL